MAEKTLYYGDNLDVLRKHIGTATVDLCYIDPPFNSKRNYNQIYNNVGAEDRAQAQAFTDTWVWDTRADEGFKEILGNDKGQFPTQTVDLISGLQRVLKRGSLMAYLVSMTLRIAEIHRVLKPTGSFYLHCDPTASHYLKLLLDGIFCSRGGEFLNEIVWHHGLGAFARQDGFPSKHDTLLLYAKGRKWTFDKLRGDVTAAMAQKYSHSDEGGQYMLSYGRKYYLKGGKPIDDVWEIPAISPTAKERLGYPTQKPEALLERIIAASSNEGDVVLDAYCGCGTTVAVAQAMKRRWIGIDITYQSIALVLRRLEDQFGSGILDSIILDGIPRDMDSATALAHKQDDRLRKEFEKWAILTYTNNRAIINDKKGADAGIDGVAFFQTGATDNAKVIFQAKSGGVGRGEVAKLRGDMEREGAAMAVLITLEPVTRPMEAEAKAAGSYHHDLMGRSYDRIQIVSAQDIVENGKRLDLPMSLEVLKAAQLKAQGNQLGFELE